MGQNSAIEWTDHTFNPWVGCTKVSAACDHCYADDLNCGSWNMEEHEVPAGAADLLAALGLPLPAGVRVAEGSQADEANEVREEAA